MNKIRIATNDMTLTVKMSDEQANVWFGTLTRALLGEYPDIAEPVEMEEPRAESRGTRTQNRKAKSSRLIWTKTRANRPKNPRRRRATRVFFVSPVCIAAKPAALMRGTRSGSIAVSRAVRTTRCTVCTV